MDENDPRSHAGRAGHRSERAMGSRKGRTRARIITADLRVMGTPTRSRPLARSVAAHVVAFLFDNGLTDEWGRGRCDLHACHLDHPSLARLLAQLLAPLNVNVKGLRDGKARAKGPRRTRRPPRPLSLPGIHPLDRTSECNPFRSCPFLMNSAIVQSTSAGVSGSTNRINAALSRSLAVDML